MTYKPYSIVVVPFPFTDKAQTKRRPAIVLSSKNHQEDTEHITLLMVTTAKNSNWQSDYQIKDLTQAGLPVPSIARQKIFTIDSKLVLHTIGHLALSDKKAIVALLHSNLTLD